MATDYYSSTGGPVPHAPGASASMRAELAAIEAGFAKLPGLSGNGLKSVRVKSDASGLEAVDLSGIFLPAGGGTMTGRITFAAAVGEVLRMQNAAPYLSAYDAAGAVRTGYLSFNAGTHVDLAAENGADIRMFVGGVARGLWDTAGNFNVLAGVISLPSANTAGLQQKLTSAAGLGGLLVQNSAAQRVLELYYLGSAQGGVYGAGNGDIVLNASSSSAQRVVLSFADVARTFFTPTGIGIGTAPTVDLDLLHSGASPTVALRAGVGFAAILELVGNGNSMGTSSFTLAQDSSGGAQLVQRANASLSISTNNLTRFILDNAGQAGWNCTPIAGVMQRFQHPGANDVGFELLRQNATDLILQGYNRSGSTYANVLFEGATFDFGIAGTAGKVTLDASSVLKYAGKEVGFRGLPAASVTTGAFAASDRGKCVYATGGVTIPNAVMSAEDVVVIQDTTGAGQTITAGATTHKSGTALTGNRTLTAWGRCSIVFLSGTVCVISGDIT